MVRKQYGVQISAWFLLVCFRGEMKTGTVIVFLTPPKTTHHQIPKLIKLT